ncbi:hypothetical protein EDB89DRAFT_1906497 [Lactarius sanguifluus]|nr:hypothetical protein EDB89DRAFT_1906497 [Lactarius sanguifluus]
MAVGWRLWGLASCVVASCWWVGGCGLVRRVGCRGDGLVVTAMAGLVHGEVAMVSGEKDSLKAELVVVLRVATAWWGVIWSLRGGVVVVENLLGKVRVGLFTRMEQIGGRETNREPIARMCRLNVRLSDNCQCDATCSRTFLVVGSRSVHGSSPSLPPICSIVAVQPERNPRNNQKYAQDDPQWDREVRGATAVLEDLLEKWKEEPYARDHVRAGRAVGVIGRHVTPACDLPRTVRKSLDELTPRLRLECVLGFRIRAELESSPL